MSKFKDTAGKWLTKSLFVEDYTDTSRVYAVYTLKPEDYEYNGVLYPSLKRLYLESNDPTEYNFAREHLGGWDHWQRLLNNKWLVRDHISLWREELEVKMRSEALRAMRQTALTEGSKGTAAAKYIIEKGWEPKRGRPSKEEVQRQQKIHARIRDEVAEDAERMGLIN